MFRWIKKKLARFKNGNYFYILHLLPLKKNKIVFSNYLGKGYGDNCKYIAEEIIKQNLDYKLIWLVDKKIIKQVILPRKIKKVKYGSVRALYELSTAKIWIDNTRKVFYPPKRKKQYYIQTWHASMGIKKIEKDAEKKLQGSYIEIAKRDSAMCDLMISGSEFRYELYKNSFWYNGQIIKSGTPRCDLFFEDNLNIKLKVYEQFKIEVHKKILLFAPTFREIKNGNLYCLDYKEVLKAVEEKFDGEWVVLVRLHPNIALLDFDFKFNNQVINATYYQDMQELLAVADILITDYSSSMFDMAIRKTPCFLHTVDLREYLKNDRQLYFDLDELPFMISQSTEQLMKNISEFKEEEYLEAINAFNYKIKNYEDGKASQRVIDKIKQIIEPIGVEESNLYNKGEI